MFLVSSTSRIAVFAYYSLIVYIWNFSMHFTVHRPPGELVTHSKKNKSLQALTFLQRLIYETNYESGSSIVNILLKAGLFVKYAFAQNAGIKASWIIYK